MEFENVFNSALPEASIASHYPISMVIIAPKAVFQDVSNLSHGLIPILDSANQFVPQLQIRPYTLRISDIPVSHPRIAQLAQA